ncbi:TlpA family protein disulfide reductase [bacterium]|nr:MAG: TlpA family protein disulfide reductase [bacterium]
MTHPESKGPAVRRIFPFPVLMLPLLLLTACAGSGPGPEETTLIHVADPAPGFALELVDGGTFDLAEHHGDVVLVNFFTTWCPPCQEEMPHLKEQVWERFGGEGFAMVSVAREETADVVAPFAQKYGAAWPFALDPERQAFARYAEAFIPRNFVISRDGLVVFQSSGYEEPEFARMVEIIEGELAR